MAIHPLLIRIDEAIKESKFRAVTGHIKPRKQLLPYILVGETGLESAIAFANKLFKAFEKAGCPVVISSQYEPFSRGYRADAVPDLRRIPSKTVHNEYHQRSEHWAPRRETICRVGTVPFSIQIFEMVEDIELVWHDGKYYRKGTEPKLKQPRFSWGHENSDIREFCCGKLGVRVCSAYYYDGQWSKVWKEDKARSLHKYIDEIVHEAIAMASTVAVNRLEYLKQQEIKHREWMMQCRKEEIAREIKRLEELREKSKKELLVVIEKWAENDRIARFFVRLEKHANSFPDEQRSEILGKIAKAKELILDSDPFAYFEQWKLP
jgi:hypothetical protein